MLAGLPEVVGADFHLAQYCQISLAQRGELVQQFSERFALALFKLRETVERVERSGGAVVEDDLCARYPINSLAMNQVSDYVIRTPGFRPLVVFHPISRQAVQHRFQSRGRTG